MNNEEVLYIGRVSKLSRKRLGFFVEPALNVFWKPGVGKRVLLNDKEYLIDGFDLLNKSFFIKIAQLDNLQALFDIVGAKVFAPKADFDVESYSRESIVGCEAYTQQGEMLGLVVDIYNAPAGSILEIEKNNIKSLVPFKKEFVKMLDVQAKKIIINPIEGMM